MVSTNQEMVNTSADYDIRKILQTAKALLMHEDNAWTGNFPSLSAEIHIEATKKKLRDVRLNSLNMLTSYITQDVRNIGTIITRLAWMRKKACHDNYLEQMWIYFAGVDIQTFHIELRSIMDYVAESVAECASKKKTVPTKFRVLRQWCIKNPGNRKRLGADFTKLIMAANWFDDILNVRDMLIHHGAYTLVFSKPADGILFQIYGKGYRQLTKDDFYIVENNIASFEKYATLYLSHLMIFLEQFAALSRHKLSFTGDISNAKLHSFGFDILVKWIDSSLEYINSKD